MTIVHMGESRASFTFPSDFPRANTLTVVMFKFRPEVTQEHKDTFVRELKRLKNLDCVKGHRLVVGGPSVTDPIERSKGFEIALLSFHESMDELQKYQASKEHHWYGHP